jgi:hypothetical protein
LCDVFLPSPEEVSGPPLADVEAEGRIVSFSDSGPTHRAFAVVDLDDGQTVVVPVDKLRL